MSAPCSPLRPRFSPSSLRRVLWCSRPSHRTLSSRRSLFPLPEAASPSPLSFTPTRPLGFRSPPQIWAGERPPPPSPSTSCCPLWRLPHCFLASCIQLSAQDVSSTRTGVYSPPSHLLRPGSVRGTEKSNPVRAGIGVCRVNGASARCGITGGLNGSFSRYSAPAFSFAPLLSRPAQSRPPRTPTCPRLT